MLIFDYRTEDRRAILRWEAHDEHAKWLKILCSICLESSNDAQREGGTQISLPWWNFLTIRSDVLDIISAFHLSSGQDFSIFPTALRMLNEARVRHESFLAEADVMFEPQDLTEMLTKKGFVRRLTNEQLRNVSKLMSIPCGATFSVPGAGKTTEALALFALRARKNDHLLVVAPKNAFAAWDEQILECIPSYASQFLRLRKTEKIPIQLRGRPKLMIIGYQQLVRVSGVVSEFLFDNDVHVFLDESHRIKGANSLSTQAILNFSHLPKNKLIMSGTPMPQSVEDLVPQFNFLYPEVRANPDNVVDLVRRIYVRTNKSELNLPEVTRHLTRVRMSESQEKLYTLLKSEIAREAERALAESTKYALRRFGRSVITVLQFVSNPALLASKPEFEFAGELSDALAEGEGPKIRYVIARARELTREGNKVLIWTSFVKNVEYLSECLQDLGAVYIHGGVDAGSDEDEDTREGKIKRFHDDPKVQVMIANPAAASEGISLHRVCHHAIYLDRSFNAAQYLQSEDRIHRLGLAANQETHIEVVECIDTVDETVRLRLELKVAAMARVLEDSNLSISSDYSSALEDTDEDIGNLDFGDVEALASAFRQQ